jgi:glycerol uptake facilitator-like aquaporin
MLVQTSPAGEHVWVIVCHMALILICIYIFAPISGAHFNPSVTIAVLFCRRITVLRCLCYLAAQLGTPCSNNLNVQRQS